MFIFLFEFQFVVVRLCEGFPSFLRPVFRSKRTAENAEKVFWREIRLGETREGITGDERQSCALSLRTAKGFSCCSPWCNNGSLAPRRVPPGQQQRCLRQLRPASIGLTSLPAPGERVQRRQRDASSRLSTTVNVKVAGSEDKDWLLGSLLVKEKYIAYIEKSKEGTKVLQHIPAACWGDAGSGAGAFEGVVIVPRLLLGHGGEVLKAGVVARGVGVDVCGGVHAAGVESGFAVVHVGGLVEVLVAQVCLSVDVVLDVVAVVASAQIGHYDEHKQAVEEDEGPLHDGGVAPVLRVQALGVGLAHERAVTHNQDDSDARPHGLGDGTYQKVADLVVSVVNQEGQRVCTDVRKDKDDKQDDKNRVRSRVLPIVLQTGCHQDAQAANDAERYRQRMQTRDEPVERHGKVVLLRRAQVVVLDDGPYEEDAHHCRPADEDRLQVRGGNVRKVHNVVRHLVVVRVQDRSPLGEPADHQRHKHRPPPG